MRKLPKIALWPLTFALVSSCASNVVQDENRYIGCYELNGRAALMIGAHYVSDTHEHRNEMRGFEHIRNSDFLTVKNRMLVNGAGKVVFAAEATGYHYEFERSRGSVLILYDEQGKQFDLIRSGPVCH